MESFGRNMLRLRSQRSATWKHPILTFDLTLTWHVTSILNFRKWFGSVSSRSFECRLVRLSTSIRFRDSRGGGVGSDPPPPGCGGYRNSPGGGGLKVVCLLTLAIWSYGHEVEEYIFLDLPFPSNPWKILQLSAFRVGISNQNLPRRVIDCTPNSFHNTVKKRTTATILSMTSTIQASINLLVRGSLEQHSHFHLLLTCCTAS